MPSTTSPANAAATGAPAATAPGVGGVVAGVGVAGTGAGVAGAASTSGPAGTTEGTDGCRAAPCPTLGAAVAGRATSRTAAAVETARRGARILIAFPDAQFTAARTTGCPVTISTIAGQRHLRVKRSRRHDPAQVTRPRAPPSR